MNIHSSLFRLSCTEARLLHRQGAPVAEVAPEKMRQYTDGMKNQATCRGIVLQLQNEPEGVLLKVRNHLDHLDPEVKGIIKENLAYVSRESSKYVDRRDATNSFNHALATLRGELHHVVPNNVLVHESAAPASTPTESGSSSSQPNPSLTTIPAVNLFPSAGALGAVALGSVPPGTAEKLSAPKTWTDGVSDWWKKNVDTRFSRETQIAVGVTAGLGIPTLFMLWNWIRGGKGEKNSEKKSGGWSRFMSWLKWVPILGIGAVIGHSIVKEVSAPYRKTMDTLGQTVSAIGQFLGIVPPSTDDPSKGGNGPGSPNKPESPLWTAIKGAGKTAVAGAGIGTGVVTEIGTGAEKAASGLLGVLGLGTQNAEKNLNKYTAEGGAFVQNDEGFWAWWGNEWVRLPGEYIQQIANWLEGKPDFWSFGTIIGTTGTFYFFNRTAAAVIATRSLAPIKGLTMGKFLLQVIGTPVQVVVDGVRVGSSVALTAVRDTNKIMPKLRGFPFLRYRQERGAIAGIKNFAKTGDYRALEPAMETLQTFMSDAELAAYNKETGWIPRITWDDKAIEGMQGNKVNVRKVLKSVLGKAPPPPPDAPLGYRKLWEARFSEGKMFDEVVLECMDREGRFISDAAAIAGDVAHDAGSATRAGEAATHTAEEGGAHARRGPHGAGELEQAHQPPSLTAKRGRNQPPPLPKRGEQPALVGAGVTADTKRAAVGGERLVDPRGPRGSGLAGAAEVAERGAGGAGRTAAAAAAASLEYGAEGSGRLVGASLANAPEAWRSHKPLEILANSYKGEVTAIFESALRRVSTLTTSAEDAVRLLQEAHVVNILAHDAPILERAFKIAVAGQSDIVPAVRRLAAFIGCLGEKINPSMLSEGIIKRVIQSDVSVVAMRRIFRPNIVAELGLRGEETAVKLIDEALAHATKISRTMLAVGGAAEAAMAVFDFYTAKEAEARVTQAKESLEKFVKGPDFIPVAGGYQHKVTGQVFSIEVTQKRLSALTDPDWSRFTWDTGSAVFAGGTAVTSVFAPAAAASIAMGPAGWVVLSAVLVSHGVNSFKEAKNRHQFIRDTSLPLLDQMGVSRLFSKSELTLASDASSWLMMDLSSADDSGKQLERKKAYMLMIANNLREYAKTNPEFVLEVTGGQSMSQFLDESGELFRHDFEKIILPVLGERMFYYANDPNAHWSQFKAGRICEGSLDSTNIDREDADKAIIDALSFYRQYRRIKHRDALRAEVAQLGSQPSAPPTIKDMQGFQAEAAVCQQRAELMQALQVVESETIFGAPASTVPSDASVQLIDAAVKKLDAATPIRTVQLPGGTFGPSQKTEETPRSALKNDAFTIPLPAFALPSLQGKRSLPLWEIARESSVSTITDKQTRADDFLTRAHTILDLHGKEVAADGLVHRSVQLNATDRDTLGKYFQLLSEFPEHDPDGSLRTLLKQQQEVPIAQWKGANYTASALIDKNAVYAQLQHHLSGVDTQYAKEYPVDRATRPVISYTEGDKITLSPGAVRQWRHEVERTPLGVVTGISGKYVEVDDPDSMETIHVVFGNDTISIKANVPQKYGSPALLTKKTIEGLGTFVCTCTLEAPTQGAQPKPVFTWELVSAYPGAKCYYYTVDKNGAQTLGNWLEVKALPREELVWNAATGESFNYAQSSFRATLFLTDGTKIEARTPPLLPRGSKEERKGSIGGYVTVLQTAKGWQFTPDTGKAGVIDRIELTSQLSPKKTIRRVPKKESTPPIVAAQTMEERSEKLPS